MKKNVNELIAENKKLIESEARKYSTHIPYSSVLLDAYELARDAAEDYSPASGVKFSTFLVNRLQKLSRKSTQFGNIVRFSETNQFKINKINQTENMFKNAYGRDATVQEISEHTGLNMGTVNSLLKNRKKETTLANLSDHNIFDMGQNDDWIHFVYHDLPANDKLIFEHKTGFGNKPILQNSDLSKKLKMSDSLLNKRLKLIETRLKEGINLDG